MGTGSFSGKLTSNKKTVPFNTCIIKLNLRSAPILTITATYKLIINR